MTAAWRGAGHFDLDGLHLIDLGCESGQNGAPSVTPLTGASWIRSHIDRGGDTAKEVEDIGFIGGKRMAP